MTEPQHFIILKMDLWKCEDPYIEIKHPCQDLLDAKYLLSLDIIDFLVKIALLESFQLL